MPCRFCSPSVYSSLHLYPIASYPIDSSLIDAISHWLLYLGSCCDTSILGRIPQCALSCDHFSTGYAPDMCATFPWNRVQTYLTRPKGLWNICHLWIRRTWCVHFALFHFWIAWSSCPTKHLSSPSLCLCNGLVETIMQSNTLHCMFDILVHNCHLSFTITSSVFALSPHIHTLTQRFSLTLSRMHTLSF